MVSSCRVAAAESPSGTTARVKEVAAQLRLIVNERDAAALLRGGDGGCDSSRAATDNRYVGVEVEVLVARRIVRRRRGVVGHLAEAGDAADEWLDKAPGGRVGEGLVVETDRHQPVEPLGNGQPVSFQRGGGVLVAHLHPGADRLGAGADVRCAVHVDQAVGAAAGGAQQAARPVVLEAAAENALPGAIQGRRDGIAGLGGRRLAVEGERGGWLVVHTDGLDGLFRSLMVLRTPLWSPRCDGGTRIPACAGMTGLGSFRSTDDHVDAMNRTPTQ